MQRSNCIYVSESEISVFVELAGGTFGEDDLATHKSLCLHNALNGYLPLLYDANVKNSDYETFLGTCRKVWKSLETNRELPQNLVHSICSLLFAVGSHNRHAKVLNKEKFMSR